MENDIITAKGLLLGHRNDIVEDFISKRIKESSIVGMQISRSNSSMIYSNISDILLELYQKTGIDLYYDKVDLFDNTIQFVVKYVDNNEEFEVKVNT